MKRLTAISDQSFPNQITKWHINSIFDQTFNLSDLKNPAMLCFTKKQQKIVPGGVYLASDEFAELKTVLPRIQSITGVDEGLLFQTVEQKWLVVIKPKLTTRIAVKSAPLIRTKTFIAACQTMKLSTGFSYPIVSFCKKSTNPYYSMMCKFSDVKEIQHVVDYLIGRGRGLTPSGDDFLLGWLLIATLTQSKNPLASGIEKRIGNQLFTTDISRNYLARGIKGEFSQALLDVAAYLTNESTTLDLKTVIEEVVDYGSTSGIDSLAGILSGLLLVDN